MDKLQFLTPAHKHMHRMALGIQLWGEVLASIFSCILVLLKSPFAQYFQFIGCFWPVKSKRKEKCHWCCVPGLYLMLEELCKFGARVQTLLKVFKLYIIPC